MSDREPQFLTVGEGADARRIAILQDDGNDPGLLWLGGFKSDMIGTKAEALSDWAKANGRRCTRFDYSGHGWSEGAFEKGTISAWAEEARAVFEACCTGPTIAIGSSMGGWIALLLAKALAETGRKDGARLSGLVLVAPAPDFTEKLMWASFPDAVKKQIEETGRFEEPSEYSDEPYLITRDLIEDGRNNLLMDAPIVTGCPVHILQGMEDPDVPWQHAQSLFAKLVNEDAIFTLIKDGDHRLSRPQDIERLLSAVADMAEDTV